MLNILISGSNGKMGKELAEVININEDARVVYGFDKLSSGAEKFPIFTNADDILADNVDIIIDFSTPEATLEILKFATENKKPIVIATTGFTEEQKNIIKDASNIIPIFMAPNMSFEIFLMSKLIKEAYKYLKDNDIEIIETHHRRKIDAPSGTAMFLADALVKESNNELNLTFDRHSRNTQRPKKEIGMHAIRGGNIVGEHSVLFFDNDETFEIKHTAHSRAVFAKGALRAAIFLQYKDAGLYSMEDILN